MKQLIPNFPGQLFLTKPLKQPTDNLNATKKRSKVIELSELLGSKSCSGNCVSRSHWQYRSALTWWVIILNGGTERDIACVSAFARD
jgi:hypothetical protein